MSLDDDLRRSGRAIASAAAGGEVRARRLRARRRRARMLAGSAVVLVALAGTAAVVLAQDQDHTVVDTTDQTPSTTIEAGQGESRVTAGDGSRLGSIPATAPDGTGDPVLDRVAGELLDDPAVADRLAALGVTGDRGARSALLADAGLVIETTIRSDALDAARRSVGAVTGAGAALVSIDPSTGEIVALAGPVGTVSGPAGELVFPFNMAAALAGGVGPGEDIPAPGELSIDSTANADGSPWLVANFGRQDLGTVTLAEAVAQSVNTPWVALFDQGRLAPAAAVEVARRLGITFLPNERPPDGRAYPADLLGIATVEPVELAEAYATFASAGRRPDAHTVKRILAADGTVLYDATSRPGLPGSALDAGIAVQVRTALEQAICCGTGTEASLGEDVAQFGKTGRTQGGLQAWFAGSTPDLTTVAWTGVPEGASPISGTGLPSQLWRSYMAEAAHPTGLEFPN